MNEKHCIDCLARFPILLQSVIEGVDADALTRRGHDQRGWSIVEILCHLADEEVEDFRVRLELTLNDPSAPWPGIDPEGVAVSRAYREQNAHDALKRFTRAREDNVRWLTSLESPDWSIAHLHPRIGAISAGDLLASWAAHDLLHLRQITKRLFEGVQLAGQPHTTEYAGQWTA